MEIFREDSLKLSADIVEDYLIVTLKGELDHHTSEDVEKRSIAFIMTTICLIWYWT